MYRLLVLIVCLVLLLAVITLVVLAVSYHRVIVVEGIGGTPIPGAYITIQRSSGSSEEIGRTDASGRFAFWTSPLPLPRLVCAQSTFYPPACVNAMSFAPHWIELAVPAGAP